MELSKKNWFNKYLHWVLSCDTRTYYYNKNSWDYMPKSLCNYFWTAVLCVLFSPIIVPINTINRSISCEYNWLTTKSIFNYYASSVLWIFTILGVLFLLGMVYIDVFLGANAINGLSINSFADILLMYGYGTIMLIIIMIGIGLIISIAWSIVSSIHLLYDAFKSLFNTKSKSSKKSSIIKEYTKAKKNKYCPKIDYK